MLTWARRKQDGALRAITGCMMRSLTKSALLLLLLVSLAAALHADTVNLKLVNTLPNNNSGGVYTYPYNFSVNGSPALIALLCDDYNHEVQLGESWYANVNTLAGAATGAGQFSATAYYQAGWLFQQLVNNAPYASPNSINWAIWKTTSPTLVVPSSVMGSVSTQGSVAWWLAQVPTTIDPNALSINRAMTLSVSERCRMALAFIGDPGARSGRRLCAKMF